MWTPIPAQAQAYSNGNGYILRYEAGPGWIIYHEEIEDEFMDSFLPLADLLNNPGISFVGTDPITGKLSPDLLPSLAITDVHVVTDQAAMLALSCQKGDVAVRLDSGQTFMLAGDNPAVLANWVEVTVSNPNWSQIQGRPTEFAPSAHPHAIDDVTGLQAALDGKASTGHNHDGNYAPPTHPHVIDDVTGLQAALDGKAATGHNHDGSYAPSTHPHAIDNVTGLQVALDAKISTSQKGAASGVAPLGSDSKIHPMYLPSSGPIELYEEWLLDGSTVKSDLVADEFPLSSTGRWMILLHARVDTGSSGMVRTISVDGRVAACLNLNAGITGIGSVVWLYGNTVPVTYTGVQPGGMRITLIAVRLGN